MNYPKLIKQIWIMRIRGKRLILILKRTLKVPVKIADGTITYPEEGAPQGGVTPPLLAGTVLNESDHWTESQ